MLPSRHWTKAGAVLLALGAAETTLAAPIDPWEESRYFLYVGRYTDTRYTQLLQFERDFKPSYVGVLGVTTRITGLGAHAHLEGEVQVGQHWGRQHNREANGLIAARWLRFPWDEVLDTSAAFGIGASFASRVPEVEDMPGRPGARRLVYFHNEIEFSRPGNPHTSVFLRLHHRSGMYDVVSEARGSNFLGIGVRRGL
jgi:hypothetical protein